MYSQINIKLVFKQINYKMKVDSISKSKDSQSKVKQIIIIIRINKITVVFNLLPSSHR